MTEAVLWGLVSGAALLVGAAVGCFLPLSGRASGLLMAFGGGVLVSALAFELTAEAQTRGGVRATVGGLVAGGVVFAVGDRLIDLRGGEHRKRSNPPHRVAPGGRGGETTDGQAGGAMAAALVLGALLDGVPESLAIGVTLLEGEGVGLAFVVAVFLSNLPEAAASSKGMRVTGHSVRAIFATWTAVMAVSGLAAGVGYLALDGASGASIAVTQAFAAGAILTMLADTMMPEAHVEAGRWAAIATLAGFVTAVGLTFA